MTARVAARVIPYLGVETTRESIFKPIACLLTCRPSRLSIMPRTRENPCPRRRPDHTRYGAAPRVPYGRGDRGGIIAQRRLVLAPDCRVVALVEKGHWGASKSSRNWGGAASMARRPGQTPAEQLWPELWMAFAASTGPPRPLFAAHRRPFSDARIPPAGGVGAVARDRREHQVHIRCSLTHFGLRFSYIAARLAVSGRGWSSTASDGRAEPPMRSHGIAEAAAAWFEHHQGCPSSRPSRARSRRPFRALHRARHHQVAHGSGAGVVLVVRCSSAPRRRFPSPTARTALVTVPGALKPAQPRSAPRVRHPAPDSTAATTICDAGPRQTFDPNRRRFSTPRAFCPTFFSALRQA